MVPFLPRLEGGRFPPANGIFQKLEYTARGNKKHKRKKLDNGLFSPKASE
jgi:hypothetical protein